MVGFLRAFIVSVLLGAPAAGLAQSRDLATYALFGDTEVTLGQRVIVQSGDVGSNEDLTLKPFGTIASAARVAANYIKAGTGVTVFGEAFLNYPTVPPANFVGPIHQPIPFPLPILTLPPPPTVVPGAFQRVIPRGGAATVFSGAYSLIQVSAGATLILQGGTYDVDRLLARGGATILCQAAVGCTVRVLSQLTLAASAVGVTGSALHFDFAGTRTAIVGQPGAVVRATLHAPLARVRVRSSRLKPTNFIGRIAAARVLVGTAARIQGMAAPGPVCGDGELDPPAEECDPPADSACPGLCQPDCQCPPPPSTAPVLHSVGPSVLQNATSFGVQLSGELFQPGAQLELSDKVTGTVIQVLPTTFVSPTELTALVPPGMPVPSGIQRELVAKVINPDAQKSGPPTIGHCQNDAPSSPIACTASADCPPGTGPCVTGDQRLTMFNDAVFINPNSAAVVPGPHGLCDDGSLCQSAAACTGIGSGACSPKLYVTPQQVDEVWVYNTGTGQFADQNPGLAGIQGIPVGDNPFHVEILEVGGPSRAWVVNRFDDAVSIIDPATDTEVVRVTGTGLGIPGHLRMETEIEFNRAGTRAYLSNENLDEVQVLDISGANRDAPLFVGSIDVGVNPRGMATNAADTRLYVANIQSADLSVVDIGPGSPTENQVVATVAARATDDIVGGRADGWEAFVIGGRAPRGIVFSDAQNALFVTSIGPQTGPRAGVVQVGGAIINPTITVIDATTNTVVAHVALDGSHPDRVSCSDPELMALDDVRGRLYVTCQGSGTVDVLDTVALSAGTPAEVAITSLPLPADVSVPLLPIPPLVGAFGAKVCAAFTSNPGTPCTSGASCTGCPSLVEGLPVVCCATNNPVGLHNGPRGIAISGDRNTLYVVNQFTTSVATLDVSASDPTLATVTGTRSFPGAFGSNTAQSDRRLGQIEFFTDVKKTSVSCATCHIDDHQDGVFFEADVAGPRLRRVLSVRGTRDTPPLLQDQLLPDLVAFTDVVVHIERGGPVCIPCTELGGVFTCFPAPEGTCTITSNAETQQNTLYAKAITFFPNPNLNADGSFSTAVPLPGGVTGNATAGAVIFDQLACQSCHPEPLFTLDQFRVFTAFGFSSVQSRRMREVSTPVLVPLRERCQDANRPTGVDGSSGFAVPTLRGIWDTFPLLLSGAAGLQAVGSEPAFAPGCTPGSSGCCTQLQSPLNPGGIALPEQHLAVSTKDAIRATLTPPLAVPGSGHGAVLALSPTELNDLIAYIRSL